MRDFLAAFWTEGSKVSITKLMAVIGTVVVYRYIVVTGDPDWTGCAAFLGAVWGLVQVRKHVTGNGGSG